MNRLKEVRIATGKKQYEVAEDLGTSHQVLSRYERGETEPDYKTLRRLADYYGVSIDYLLCHENPTYAPLNFEGDAAANVRILGKAVAFISTVR